MAGAADAETPFADQEALEASIRSARDALIASQHPDGYWCFELEADCTIPAEYVLMMHYLGEIDRALQAKMAAYLRAHQQADGGWPLFFGGELDISCSVKAYYALKLAGDAPQAPHMDRAKEAILTHGGAARANVFTRITLALFGQVPWRATPFMPVEILLLPPWFPFHLDKTSYWSRTVMVPLLILCSLKPQACNPHGAHIRELFEVPAEQETRYFPVRSSLNRAVLLLERFGRVLEPWIPRRLRARALRKAETWVVERLNDRDGLGAIFPAMVNAVEALDCLGYPPSHPDRAAAREALQGLVVDRGAVAYCQPCFSPVWDTALACLALQDTGGADAQAAVRRALDWLQERQLLEDTGDWRGKRPRLRGGGWPFQFRNSHYPDLDDTAAVAWAMDQTEDPAFSDSIRRAADWICGMQSRNGGFAAFDVDNTHTYLNEIPFADHGALLDPPTADVSARCLTLLARLGGDRGAYRRALEACLAYLRAEQEANGSWFGRWGTNHIYGTWSALVALEQAGVEPEHPDVRRAVAWLKGVQRPDGGWGEDNDSYWDPQKAGRGDRSTSFQTAWAILGLVAAGEVDSDSVRNGVEHLLRTRRPDGTWEDADFTAPGFPRVFYLKYHGYSQYFPLWALARYRNLAQGQSA
ncbi:MAG: squalene--hopene cyclase [Pseudomonadota bacterium]|nr:squalene--hopene cyclase [Pseudomonadota bacterium]